MMELSLDAARLLELLRRRGATHAAAALSDDTIADALRITSRGVTACASELGRAGYAIASSCRHPYGYFVAIDRRGIADARAAVRTIHARGRATIERAELLAAALDAAERRIERRSTPPSLFAAAEAVS